MGLGIVTDKWPADDFDYASFGQQVEALQAYLVKVSQAHEVLPELLQERKRLIALLESMGALIDQPHFAQHLADFLHTFGQVQCLLIRARHA